MDAAADKAVARAEAPGADATLLGMDGIATKPLTAFGRQRMLVSTTCVHLGIPAVSHYQQRHGHADLPGQFAAM